MEDPRKKPEPDMEIAKAYRSIIMGPQRENLGRGACFLGQRWENWKLQPFTFQSSGIFDRNVDPHAPLQPFLMDCHILHIISYYIKPSCVHYDYMYTHTDAHIKQARGADRFQRSPFPVWMIPFRFSSHKDGIRTGRSSTSQPSQRRPIYTYTVLRLLASAACRLIQPFARGRTNDALQQEGEEECLFSSKQRAMMAP